MRAGVVYRLTAKSTGALARLEKAPYIWAMHPHRSLFASVLLAVVLMGGTLGPAVHWASHGQESHHEDAHTTEAPQATHQHCPHEHGVAGSEEDAPADSKEREGQSDSCLDCVYLQQVAGSEATPQSFSAQFVGFEQAVPTPESPATETDVIVPGERGPPQVG